MEESKQPLQPQQAPVPPDVKADIDFLRQSIVGYQKEQKQAKHDPLKVVVAGMVNEHMLHETAAEQKKALSGKRTPSPAQLKNMQSWAFEHHKKYPWKNADQVAKATAGHFNLNLVDEPVVAPTVINPNPDDVQ